MTTIRERYIRLLLSSIFFAFHATCSLVGITQYFFCTTTINTSSNANIEADGAAALLCITGGTFSGNITLKNRSDLCISTGVTFSPNTLNHTNTSVMNKHGNWSTAFQLTLDGTINNFGNFSISFKEIHPIYYENKEQKGVWRLQKT